MRTLSFLISLLVFAPAFADNNNPDAGRLTRIVCYGLRTPGDLSTRDPRFSIVISQDRIEEDSLGNSYDASHFVPGNRNFNVDNSSNSVFTVSIYKNAKSLSSSTDPQVYAEELLSNEPNLTYTSSEGGRINNTYSVGLGAEGNGSVDINMEEQYHSMYDDGNTFDIRFLHCETPFGISNPNTPAPATEPTSQSAELGSDQSGVNSEI